MDNIMDRDKIGQCLNNVAATVEDHWTIVVADIMKITSMLVRMLASVIQHGPLAYHLLPSARTIALFVLTCLAVSVLKYSSSGKSARCKFNVPAIGTFSDYMVKQWSFRHWRWEYYYPVIERDLFETSQSEPPNPKRTKLFLHGHRFRLVLDSRPRATWAQLMSIAVDSGLVLSDTHRDVDSIPGSLDVPPQIVSLVSLGKLAAYLGCDSVSIDAQSRNFQAAGSFGTITTEQLAGFGSVVRFQTYHVPFPTTLRYDSWYKHVSHLVEGIFDIDAYKIQTILDTSKADLYMFGDPPSVLMRNEANHMVSVLRKEGSNVLPVDVYESVNTVPDSIVETILTHWQDSLVPVFNGTKFPSILVTLAIAAFPRAINGFPGRSLLLPFLAQCRQISQAVYKQYEKALSDTPTRWNLRLLVPLKRLSDPGCAMASLWIPRSDSTIDSGLEKSAKEYVSELGQAILPQLSDLIKNFDPRSWVQSFRERTQDAPLDMLKIQISLLDIRIRHILEIVHREYASHMKFGGCETLERKGDRFQGELPDDTFVFHVRAAILKTLSDGPSVPFELFEKFDQALRNQISMTEPFAPRHQELMSEASNLLALRIVVYAACLMITPDTSDILDTQISVGPGGFVLPMV
ncbi:hypothetical protein F4680DRAFT_453324 [Xylaria scruposa]|nr:hypothetical protein F4680DRAFT_453324 [Xylaria scruposa]